jgi:hypothetical protein
MFCIDKNNLFNCHFFVFVWKYVEEIPRKFCLNRCWRKIGNSLMY